MAKTKNFQYKGQMINYYNKIKNNPDIESVFCFWDAKIGYAITYIYKKKG